MSLGITTDLVREGAELVLPTSTLARHLGVFGLTGTGKSWFMCGLAQQLAQQGMTVWVFDRSRDFRRIVSKPDSGAIRYLRPEWIEWNPLQAPQDPTPWKHKLVGLLSSTYYGRGGAEMVLAASLDTLYQERGCYAGSQNWPTLEDWWTRLSTTQPSFRTREGGYHESALRLLHAVKDGLPGILHSHRSIPFDVLAKTSFVMDVSELNVPSYLFLLMTLLEQTSAGQYAQELQRVIYVDEASEIYNDQQVRRQEHGYPPQHDLPRRFRGRGIGLILADQSPSLLPKDIQGNLGTLVAFRLLNTGCLRMVVNAAGLSDEQAEILPGLPAQHAIVSSVGLSKPFLVRIPDLNLPAAPTLQELEHRKAEMLEGLFIQAVEMAPSETVSTTDETLHSPITSSAVSPTATHQPSASPQGASSAEKALLNLDHIRLLERLGKYPQETILERTTAERLDRMDEWKLRNHLIRFGYVSLIGKIGKHEFFGVTSVGAEFLKDRGIDLPAHKSGVLHECILRRIEEDITARTEGITTSRHGQYNGVQPDLMATNAQGGCVMIQVSCTNSASNEVDAAQRLAGIEAVMNVVVVCTTQAKVNAVRKALTREAGQPGGLFSPAEALGKVLAIHAEDVLQQRLDWQTLARPKAASKKQPDQQGGVLVGEAAEAGGRRGEEGSMASKELGSLARTSPARSEDFAPGADEDEPGGALRPQSEPEGDDEAGEEVQELQEARKPGEFQDAARAAARPGGRAEGDSRGQGTEAGEKVGDRRERGPEPEPEAREGADQEDQPGELGKREKGETGRGPRGRGPRTGMRLEVKGGSGSDPRTRTRKKTEKGELEGEGSSDEERKTAGAKASRKGMNIQQEAGKGGRQGREKVKGDRSRGSESAGQEGEVENSGGEGAATRRDEELEGGATRENDGRTTTNVKEELRTIVEKKVEKEGRRLNVNLSASRASHARAVPAEVADEAQGSSVPHLSIDLAKEEVITLKEAAGRLPRREGKKVHVSTLYRWLQKGVKGVKLETIPVGGTVCTSAEALQRFCARLSAAGQRKIAVQIRTRLRRERTDAILKDAGLMSQEPTAKAPHSETSTNH